MARTTTYKGYTITHEFVQFINNPDLLLWVARKAKCVTLRAERKQDLLNMIKSIHDNSRIIHDNSR